MTNDYCASRKNKDTQQNTYQNISGWRIDQTLAEHRRTYPPQMSQYLKENDKRSLGTFLKKDVKLLFVSLFDQSHNKKENWTGCSVA